MIRSNDQEQQQQQKKGRKEGHDSDEKERRQVSQYAGTRQKQKQLVLLAGVVEGEKDKIERMKEGRRGVVCVFTQDEIYT